MRRLRARTSLLAEFAAVSFVALILLGIVLAQTFLRTMGAEEQTRATEVATLTTRADIRPRVSVDDLDTALGNGETAALDARLRAVSQRADITGVTIWGRDNRVLYSTEKALAGTAAENAGTLKRSLEGQTTTALSRTTPAGTTATGDLLQVYVPLRASSGLTSAVLEVDFSYEALAAATKKDQQTVLGILGGSLLLIYLSMLATVARCEKPARLVIER